MNKEINIYKNELWEFNYIEANLWDFELENFYIFLQEQLEKINSILENTEQKNWLKYNLALAKKSKIEKDFQNYLKFKKELVWYDYESKDILAKIENIKYFLKDHYNINFIFDEDNFLTILDNIIKQYNIDIAKNFDSKKLNNIVEKYIFDNIYNFLYVYEEEISQLRTNPENKIILELIEWKINLYTEKQDKKAVEEKAKYEKTKQQENQKKYLEKLKSEIEQGEYDTNYKKSDENILGKLLAKKEEEPNYLEIRNNPLETEKVQNAQWNKPQQERLKKLKKSIWPDEIDKIREYNSSL